MQSLCVLRTTKRRLLHECCGTGKGCPLRTAKHNSVRLLSTSVQIQTASVAIGGAKFIKPAMVAPAENSRYRLDYMSPDDDTQMKDDLDYVERGVFRESREFHYSADVLVPAFKAVAANACQESVADLRRKMARLIGSMSYNRRLHVCKDLRKIIAKPYLEALQAVLQVIKQETSNPDPTTASTKTSDVLACADAELSQKATTDNTEDEKPKNDSKLGNSSNWLDPHFLIDYMKFGCALSFQAWALYWAEHADVFLKLWTSAMHHCMGDIQASDVGRTWSYLLKMQYAPDRLFVSELSEASLRVLVRHTQDVVAGKESSAYVKFFPYAATQSFRGLALLGKVGTFRDQLSDYCSAIDLLLPFLGLREMYNCLIALLIMDCYGAKAQPEFIDRVLHSAITLLEATNDNNNTSSGNLLGQSSSANVLDAAIDYKSNSFSDNYGKGQQRNLTLAQTVVVPKDHDTLMSTVYEALVYYKRMPEVAEKMLAQLKTKDQSHSASSSIAERKVASVLIEMAHAVKMAMKQNVWLDCIGRRVDFVLQPLSRRRKQTSYIIVYDGPSHFNFPNPQWNHRREHDHIKRLTERAGMKMYQIAYFDWIGAKTDYDRFLVLRQGFRYEFDLKCDAKFLTSKRY